MNQEAVGANRTSEVVCLYCGMFFDDCSDLVEHVSTLHGANAPCAPSKGAVAVLSKPVETDPEAFTPEYIFLKNLLEFTFRHKLLVERQQDQQVVEVEQQPPVDSEPAILTPSISASSMASFALDAVQSPTDADSTGALDLPAKTTPRFRLRKHICDFCSKPFAWKSSLDKHIRIHTGERPYHCHICPATFNQRPHLDGHLSKVHKIEPGPDRRRYRTHHRKAAANIDAAAIASYSCNGVDDNMMFD